MLEPIRDSIVFAFVDNVRNGRFVEQSESGIYLGRSQDGAADANSPRWGRVLAKGPDVSAVKLGDRILIEPTQWTFGMEYDGVKMWRTTEQHIMCVEE